MKIPITKPYLDEQEEKAVCDVLKSGWLVQGNKVAEFENMIAQYTGSKYAKACNSCTTALHMALITLGIGEGDEVLLPSFTFPASANAIEYVGAKPVFVDIDLNTFNIDEIKIERNITSRTKAIMPVHLFGLCANMDRIMELAKAYNLLVIEDAACALGSFYKGKHAGTFAEVGVFSFHPRKPITTGEGGMLITDDAEIARKVDMLRSHGENKGDFDVLGYNYRLTDIQASIGVEQMNKFPYILEQRIKRARLYNEELKNVEWLQLPSIPEGYQHSFQSYIVLVKNPNNKKLTLDSIANLHLFRNGVMARLGESGIGTRQGTYAVHATNYYRNKYKFKDEDYINSFAADRLTITLPLYPQMTDDEQKYVIEHIKEMKEG